MSPRLARAGAVILIALGGAVASCDHDVTEPTPHSTRDYVAGVALNSVGVGEAPVPYPEPVAGVFREGTPPPESHGPFIMLSARYGDPVVGEDFAYDLGTYARNDLRVFYIWVAEGTGYWEVTLPEPRGSTIYGVGLNVTITMSADAPAGPINLRATGTDTLGKNGAISTQRLIVTKADAAPEPPNVSATLSWIGGTDLDLHVVDPFGRDLSFSAPTTPEGGKLLKDASGGCVDGTANEEVAEWPHAAAPGGRYFVYVAYYGDCGGAVATPFTVTLKVAGQADRTFTGTFDGLAAGSVADTVTRVTVP